jgi:hypothetical protein
LVGVFFKTEAVWRPIRGRRGEGDNERKSGWADGDGNKVREVVVAVDRGARPSERASERVSE